MIFVTPKRPHENENPGFSNLSGEVWIGLDYHACTVGRMLGVITGPPYPIHLALMVCEKNQKNKKSAQSNDPSAIYANLDCPVHETTTSKLLQVLVAASRKPLSFCQLL